MMDRVRFTALVICFSSCAATLRLFKHMIVGSVQFVNFPAVFAVLAGVLLGWRAGFSVGILSFAVSDAFIGCLGYWTLYTSLCMGFVGALSSLVKGDSFFLGAYSYLLIFFYDILSSIIFYTILGYSFSGALVFSFVGLFLPSPPTFYPMGLVTEFVSVMFIVALHPFVERVLKLKGVEA